MITELETASNKILRATSILNLVQAADMDKKSDDGEILVDMTVMRECVAAANDLLTEAMYLQEDVLQKSQDSALHLVSA